MGDESYLTLVRDMVRNLQYGTVTIHVQDRKVVQINKEEKIRIKN